MDVTYRTQLRLSKAFDTMSHSVLVYKLVPKCLRGYTATNCLIALRRLWQVECHNIPSWDMSTLASLSDL